MEPRYEVQTYGGTGWAIRDHGTGKVGIVWARDKSHHVRKFKKLADAAKTCARLNAEDARTTGLASNQPEEGGEQNANSETATPQ